MKSLLAIFLLLVHFVPLKALQGDIIDVLAENFKTGDFKEISKNFGSSVDLIIVNQEDVYSKAQSEQILKDFFVKNPPSKINIIHRLTNNPNYRLGIYNLQTKNGWFRITVTMNLKKPSNIYQIIELRIEEDKQ